MVKLLSIIFISFSIVCVISSMGIHLDNENYKNEVLNSEEAWIIEYYSDKCGSCKQFEEIWDKVMKSVKKLKIGRVNIDNEKGMSLAKEVNVLNEGIPNVRF